jgi:hypothetical protein
VVAALKLVAHGTSAQFGAEDLRVLTGAFVFELFNSDVTTPTTDSS